MDSLRVKHKVYQDTFATILFKSPSGEVTVLIDGCTLAIPHSKEDYTKYWTEIKEESKMSDKTSEILAERGKQYGSFEGHAQLTQRLKSIFYEHLDNKNGNFTSLGLTNVEREGLDMIFHKLGRIGNGNPHYPDNFADIAGYARLVADVQEQQEGFRATGAAIDKAIDQNNRKKGLYTDKVEPR